MKRQTILLLFIAFLSINAIMADEPNRLPERKQWMKEMRQFKHDFLVKELSLSDEQQKQFFALYDKMTSELYSIEQQTRQMERDINTKGDAVTDLEYEKAAEACYELAGKKNAIEMTYFHEYKKILSKKQLFQLSGAERKFTRTIMHHRRKATTSHQNNTKDKKPTNNR